MKSKIKDLNLINSLRRFANSSVVSVQNLKFYHHQLHTIDIYQRTITRQEPDFNKLLRRQFS